MKIILGLFLCLFSVSIFGQKPKKNSHPSPNTIIYTVLSKLTENNSYCPADEKVTFVGKVIKRDFGDDEQSLVGFVLVKKNDTRDYINLDSEYISKLAASASVDLSDFLLKGKRIEVFAFRCRKIYVAYKIIGL